MPARLRAGGLQDVDDVLLRHRAVGVQFPAVAIDLHGILRDFRQFLLREPEIIHGPVQIVLPQPAGEFFDKSETRIRLIDDFRINAELTPRVRVGPRVTVLVAIRRG